MATPGCPPGCYRKAVMVLAAHLPYVRAAPMSLSQLKFIRPRSIHGTMFARALRSGKEHQNMLTWFHSVRSSSFISARFGPFAAHIVVLALPAIACVPGLYWHKIPANASMPHKAPTLCAHHGLDGHFTVRPSRWHSPAASVHSFLIHSSARCRLAISFSKIL